MAEVTATHNPIIAGWRGVSVLCVIVGHYVGYRLWPGVTIRPLHELGLSFETIPERRMADSTASRKTGVQFFFVISKLLITGLLAAEETNTGHVSLKAFYIRRLFRIVPAFSAYLFAVWLLRYFEMIRLDNEAFIRSAAFLCNVSEIQVFMVACPYVEPER